MKLYSNNGETKYIGISASPATLRAIAKFLKESANELEKMGDEFNHIHLMDEWEDWKDGTPDIQVLNPIND